MTIVYTSRHNIPSPDLPEAPVDLADMFQRRAAIFDKFADIDSGPLASRPVSSPSSPGYPRFYVVTDQDDSPRLDWDYGTGWITIEGKPMAPVERAGLSFDHDYTPTHSSRKNLVTVEATVTEANWNWYLQDYSPLVTIQGLITLGPGLSPVLSEQTTGGQWWWWWFFKGFPYNATAQIISFNMLVPPGASYRVHESWTASQPGYTPPAMSLTTREQVL